MPYVREEIHGTSGQDIMKMNENFMNIYEKVFGDINFSDVDTSMQNKINTQWIPVQGEGNLDSNYPLYIRFYIPPNANKIIGSDFNLMCERYRMDSTVTSTQPSHVYNDSQTSTEYPGATQSSTASIGAVSGVSSATVGVTSQSGGGATTYVYGWGGQSVDAPSETFKGLDSTNWGQITATDNATGERYGYFRDGYGMSLGLPIFFSAGITDMSSLVGFGGLTKRAVIDMHHLQHTHNIPSHSHSMSVSPHSHAIEVESHSHSVVIPPHSHKVSMSFEIPEHSHNLKEGIFVSNTAPNSVVMHINDEPIGYVDEATQTSNNLDLTEHLKIGEWNVIKVTTSNLARVTIYGTINVIIKNTK